MLAGELQPLDIAVNDSYKRKLKEKFTDWYAAEVSQMDAADLLSVVDLRTSLIKPLHAHWLISTHEEMQTDLASVRRGFLQAGIVSDGGTTASPPSSPEIA